MPRCENPRNPSEGRGRGTGESQFSSSTGFYNRPEGESFVLKRGKEEIGTSPVPRPLFDGADVRSPRALKGKSPVRDPRNGELVAPSLVASGKPKSRDHLRYLATSRPALSLDRADRQAAACDPGLVWDAAAYRYRFASKATPHPPLAKDGHEDGAGGSKSSRSHNAQTGGGHENVCKHQFRDPDAPRAPARGRLT